jgi:hypothetical protein
MKSNHGYNERSYPGPQTVHIPLPCVIEAVTRELYARVRTIFVVIPLRKVNIVHHVVVSRNS